MEPSDKTIPTSENLFKYFRTLLLKTKNHGGMTASALPAKLKYTTESSHIAQLRRCS